MVNEFLSEQQNKRQMVPQSFNMAGLLQEMRQIDEAMVYQQATPQRGESDTDLNQLTINQYTMMKRDGYSLFSYYYSVRSNDRWMP